MGRLLSTVSHHLFLVFYPVKILRSHFFLIWIQYLTHKNDQRLPTHTEAFEDAMSGDLVMKGLANFHPADSWTTKNVEEDMQCAYADV